MFVFPVTRTRTFLIETRSLRQGSATNLTDPPIGHGERVAHQVARRIQHVIEQLMGQILQTTGHRLVRSHERRADVPGFGIGERRIRFFDKPAPERPHLLAIVFDRVARLVPMRVGNYGDQTVRPVQVVGGDLGRGVAQIRRSVVHVRIKRCDRRERAGTEGDPHHRRRCGRHVVPQFDRDHVTSAVDADRTVAMPAFRCTERSVRVKRRAFEMRRHQKVDVLDRHLVLRRPAPRDVVGGRRVAGRGRIPILARVQVTLHVPGARRVVDMVLDGAGAEHHTRVDVVRQHGGDAETGALRGPHGTAQMVPIDEFAQVRAAHEEPPLAERVGEVEVVDAQLVGDRRIAVVGHTARNPVVPTDCLDIPDLVHVGNDHAV